MNTSSSQNDPQNESQDIARQQGLTPNIGQNITSEQISERARQLWQQAGSPEGRDLEFWLAAENELRSQNSEQTSHSVPRDVEVAAGAEEATNNEGDRETRSSPRRSSGQRAGRRETPNVTSDQQAEADVVELQQPSPAPKSAAAGKEKKAQSRGSGQRTSEPRRNG